MISQVIYLSNDPYRIATEFYPTITSKNPKLIITFILLSVLHFNQSNL